MGKRKIIEIDEEKCIGCGLCIPNCAEGALQIIDGKARLVKDEYCDGLGACLGHCPQGALKLVERQAEAFQEQAPTTSQDACGGHGFAGGCPGSRAMTFGSGDKEAMDHTISSDDIEIKIKSQLGQWPVQLHLIPVNAPYFKNADLLITADCVPIAYPNYHLDLLKGRAVAIACPKLDGIGEYTEKLSEIIKYNNLKSITVAYMEVPCCQGIVRAVETALSNSQKSLKLNKVKISIKGERL